MIMRHPIDENDENEGRDSRQRLMVFIPLAVIALVILFCVIKVLVWNKGTRYKFDGPEDPSSLDSEAMDYFATMDASLLEGRDDSETHILFLGDDIFSYGSAESSIPDRVADATGATVYNCAFPKSSFACRYDTFNDQYCTDIFSFVRIAYCIKSNDYALLDAYKTAADIYNSSFDETIERLKAVDFNKIDIIFLGYGMFDYLNGHMTTDVNDEKAICAMTGALYTGIDVIHETYPHIRFAVMAPTFCYYDEGDGTLSAGDVRRVGATDENLGGYVVALRAMCEIIGVSFIDNYFGIPLNAETAQEYLVDSVHVNDAVRGLITDKAVDYVTYRLYKQ